MLRFFLCKVSMFWRKINVCIFQQPFLKNRWIFFNIKLFSIKILFLLKAFVLNLIFICCVFLTEEITFKYKYNSSKSLLGNPLEHFQHVCKNITPPSIRRDFNSVTDCIKHKAWKLICFHEQNLVCKNRPDLSCGIDGNRCSPIM